MPPLSAQDLSLARILLRNALAHPRSAKSLAMVTTFELDRPGSKASPTLRTLVETVGHAGQLLGESASRSQLCETLVALLPNPGSEILAELVPH